MLYFWSWFTLTQFVLDYALWLRVQLCRDYALLGGHFGPKFVGWGHTNIFKDRGWISLLLASNEEFKHLVKGLVLVAPALNFFRPYYQQMFKELPQEQQAKLEKGEMVGVEDEYGITYLRKSFAEASAELELDLSKPLEVSLPCRILHGARDATIPYKNSIGLMESLIGNNVEVIVRKEAEHRFSEPKSLQVLTESLEDVIRDIEQGQQ